jgi:hypothetical protein
MFLLFLICVFTWSNVLMSQILYFLCRIWSVAVHESCIIVYKHAESPVVVSASVRSDRLYGSLNAKGSYSKNCPFGVDAMIDLKDITTTSDSNGI